MDKATPHSLSARRSFCSCTTPQRGCIWCDVSGVCAARSTCVEHRLCESVRQKPVMMSFTVSALQALHYFCPFVNTCASTTFVQGRLLPVPCPFFFILPLRVRKKGKGKKTRAESALALCAQYVLAVMCCRCGWQGVRWSGVMGRVGVVGKGRGGGRRYMVRVRKRCIVPLCAKR